MEDDVELQELTPNLMIRGRKNALLDEEVHTLDGKDLRKRAKYLEKCKNNIWKRWSDTYLKSLRERHNMKHLGKENAVKEGDVVLIKGDERNRGKWNVGIVAQLVEGRDGVIRVAKLRTKKTEIERAIQLLYPL